MNFTTTALRLIIEKCRAQPGHRAMVVVGNNHSKCYLTDLARQHLQEGEKVTLASGLISFPNGSRIILHIPSGTGATGVEVHDVFWDEEFTCSDVVRAHINARARLKS